MDWKFDYRMDDTMISSARNRTIIPGIITVTRNIDDFSYAVFSNIVYPTSVANNFGSYVDGSESINQAVASGIPTSNGGEPIDTDMFLPDIIIINNVITYPTA